MEPLLGFLMIFFIGLLSLIGLFMISMKERTLDRILFILIAFATGTILASALFDLVPESIHHLEELNAGGSNIALSLVFTFVIIGFVVFFIIERFIYWFHGHAHEKEDKYVCYETITGDNDLAINKGRNIKSFALLNLIGDGLH
ncbi:MAG: ZIP family metal transporter, partial [Candidatus Lokiarchaeota archaeon]|nr:ZIP family metal transporter [Candidatus Lokiarchaeota archaeon]